MQKMAGRVSWMLAVAGMVAAAGTARAQSRTFELTDQGWKVVKEPEPGSEEATIAKARELLAQNKPVEGKKILDEWIEANETSKSKNLPEAYLLRGDCKLADDDEYEALYDYE